MLESTNKQRGILSSVDFYGLRYPQNRCRHNTPRDACTRKSPAAIAGGSAGQSEGTQLLHCRTAHSHSHLPTHPFELLGPGNGDAGAAGDALSSMIAMAMAMAGSGATPLTLRRRSRTESQTASARDTGQCSGSVL